MVRLKTSIRLQENEMDSSSVALWIVLKFFKKHPSLYDILLNVENSPGQELFSILKLARKYGLEGQRVSLTPSYLEKLPSPVIAEWSSGHFVVIEGCDKGFIFLNDPAMGPTRISVSEFEKKEDLSGIAFIRNALFYEDVNEASLVTLFKEAFRENMTKVIYFLICSIGMAISMILLPAIIRTLIDAVLGRGLLEFRPWILGALIVASAFNHLFFKLLHKFIVKITMQLHVKMTQSYTLGIQKLTPQFFKNRSKGQLLIRHQELGKVIDTLGGDAWVTNLFEIIANIVSALLIAAILWAYSPVTTIVCLIALTSGVLFCVTYFKYQKEKAYLSVQNVWKRKRFLFDVFDNFYTIKASHMESTIFSKWASLYTQNINDHQTQTQLLGKFIIFIYDFRFAMKILVIILGAIGYVEGYMSLGSYVAMLLLMLFFTQVLYGLVVSTEMVQSLALLEMLIEDVVSNRSEKIELFMDSQTPLWGKVTFKELSYQPFESFVLNSLSLELPVGAKVAFIADKPESLKPLAQLMMGQVEPSSGEIYYDDKPKKDFKDLVIANKISYVSADTFIFKGTVKDNLTLWDSSIPYEMIVKAAQEACIYESILDKPGGFDEIVDENGKNFSIGQVYRLGLARALILNPSILIIDTLSLAIDKRTEKEIFYHLIKKGITLIFISQNTSLLKLMDQIYVLKEGKKIQEGTPQELIAQEGFYQELVQKQEGIHARAL